jgi:NADP-dependent 3-hydroxy acid dehydrogenase YdfG
MTAIKTKISFSYCLDGGVRVTLSKIWLITGSSRGLGRALAESVLAAGEKLIATARDVSQLDDFPRRFGDAVRLVSLDVTDQGVAMSAVDAAVSGFGRLDVLVNNAGYGDVSSIEDTSLADFRSQIETNLFGVINLTKAAIPTLRQQRSGHIIQVSSISGRIGPAGRGRLCGGKVGSRRVLRSSRQGTRAARHQSHDCRARRLPHRLRRFLHHSS